MTRAMRTPLAVLAVSMLALGLAACADDGAAGAAETGSEDATATDGAEDSETSESDAPAADGEPLVIGTSGTYFPITFSDGGALSGYDIDWGEEIGAELGRPVEFVEGQLAGLLTGLQAGQYDLVMSALTITPERQESIDFSDPYLADGVVAVIVAGSGTVTDISELDGVKIGVIGGSGYQAAVEELGGYSSLSSTRTLRAASPT